jgi:uncharacterized membrane protein (DUF106 family)
MVGITAFIQANPRLSIILISIVVSFFISLINYLVLDKEKVRALREKQKTLNEEMKKHKDNPQKMMEIQKEMFSHMGENLRHSFKPMIITTIPLLIVFGLIRGEFNETTLASTWIWYYIGASIIASIFFRKLFKLP